MKILLTGASGFIGRKLLTALTEREHEVSVLTASDADFNLEPTRIFRSPLEEWKNIAKRPEFDACVHLAWIATPGFYLESSLNWDFTKVTTELAESLFGNGLRHFVGVGTGIEYQRDQTAPCLEERTLIEPISVYGQAKELARSTVANIASRQGVDYTWARVFYPYGESEHPSRIPTTFLNTLKKREILTLKTPATIKDFISVHDVVSALVHLLESGRGHREINIGSGCGHRIDELAEFAADLVGADPGLINRQVSIAVDPYAFHVADISKLNSIGWRPRISVPEGLAALADFLMKTGNRDLV